MISLYPTFKLVIANLYASSNFNYDEPICYIQINYDDQFHWTSIMMSPYVSSDFNYDESVCYT